MRILATRPIPSAEILAKTLEQELSYDYVYQLFGLTGQKDVIVRKSALVGVRISKKDNEIIVSGTYPSLTTSALATLSFYLMGLGDPFLSLSWQRFEREVSAFLYRKYS